MKLRRARELAAGIYTESQHKNKVLDVDLCESIAKLLVKETSIDGMCNAVIEKIRANKAAFAIMPTLMTVKPSKSVSDETYLSVIEQTVRTIFEVIENDIKSQTS